MRKGQIGNIPRRIWAGDSFFACHRLAGNSATPVEIERVRPHFDLMDIVFYIVGGLIFAAVIVTLIERRRGKTFTIKDERITEHSTHASREQARIEGELQARTTGNHLNS